MVKRKIVWSHRARIKLYEILKFFVERNNSKTYSDKLYKKLNNALKSLDKQPDLGIKTEIDAVRGLIVGNYIIFYECTKDKIIVHTLWDSRQNPEKLNIK